MTPSPATSQTLFSRASSTARLLASFGVGLRQHVDLLGQQHDVRAAARELLHLRLVLRPDVA